MITYWQEIAQLEMMLDENNPEPLIKLIEALTKNRLLNRHMIHGLMEAGWPPYDKQYDILHEVANSIVNKEKS